MLQQCHTFTYRKQGTAREDDTVCLFGQLAKDHSRIQAPIKGHVINLDNITLRRIRLAKILGDISNLPAL